MKDKTEYIKYAKELKEKRKEWIKKVKSNDLNWNKFNKRLLEIEIKTLHLKCKRLYGN